MAQVTLKGKPLHTIGDLPKVGTKAPDFKLVKTDLTETSLVDFQGKNLILNIFPSIDTGTCATSVRKFNEKAANLKNTTVLCVSMDLPFAHSRFCGAEGISNVISSSNFRDNGGFAKDYGVGLIDGPLKGLDARAVVVIDENGFVKHSQLVSEIVDEPDYNAALAVL
jgi:thiol peroxidase